MSADSVIYGVADGVATLTINEPHRMNPLSTDVQLGCLKALEEVEGDTDVRALIVTGSGRAFCSGADLAELGKTGSSGSSQSIGQTIGTMMAETGNPLIKGLRSLRVPVVCAVNGAAAGGGFGLALAADIVIAARSAFFYLPFSPSLGLVPDMGASWVLPRVVGHARAMGLTLLGGRLTAEEAAQWGLIWACVEDSELVAQSVQIAQRLARLPEHAVREVRGLYRQSENNTLEQQLDLERERQMTLADLPSFAEGVRAFLEKRAPDFRRSI